MQFIESKALYVVTGDSGVTKFEELAFHTVIGWGTNPEYDKKDGKFDDPYEGALFPWVICEGGYLAPVNCEEILALISKLPEGAAVTCYVLYSDDELERRIFDLIYY
ncbi:MAG: hypothetical protein ACRC62_11120 [Microcoleus sp.]